MGRASLRSSSAIRVVIASALAALAVPASATAASAVPCGQMEYVTLNTLHVNVAPLKRAYHIGEVVPIKVHVSRPSENDPVGLGVAAERPTSQAAEDVNVGVGLSVGRVFLPGYNVTNAKGDTVVKIRLTNYTPKGKMAQVQAFAYMERANTPCLVVEEQGYRALPNAFKVKA
jgi:hypothetical protein